MSKRRSGKSHRLRILLILLVVMTVFIGTSAIYLSQGYPAAEDAVAALASTPDVTVSQLNGWTVFAPKQIERGLIFYPGGLVAPQAYAPLLRRLAMDGTLCVLLDPPCQLAILSPDQADGVQAAFPAVQGWYVGGHSLGGYVAAGYAARHAAAFDGLLLLAAYAPDDLTGSGLRVASVYGSRDGVMNRERYEKGLPLLPVDFQETVIDGGIHSFFGSYGLQKGDGEPTITAAAQLEQTAAAFLRLAAE